MDINFISKLTIEVSQYCFCNWHLALGEKKKKIDKGLALPIYLFIFVFFPNFVMLHKWWSSLSVFSQFENIRNMKMGTSQAPFHVEGSCGKYWWNFNHFSFWYIFIFKKKMWQNILWKNKTHKMEKNHPKENFYAPLIYYKNKKNQPTLVLTIHMKLITSEKPIVFHSYL